MIDSRGPRGRAHVVTVGILAAWLHAGCLDAGPPPVGRHLVTSRDDEQVLFVAGALGQPSRIVLSRLQTADGPNGFITQQLSTIDDPGPGGRATAPRVFVDRIGGMFRGCEGDVCTFIVDARGRLYVDRQSFMASPEMPTYTLESDELVSVDPATGELQSFGSTEQVLASPDRARVVIEPLGPVSTLTPFVRELDGTTIPLPGTSALTFVGNDLYFITDDHHLSRLAAASRTPEAVAADVTYYEAFATERGPLLVLGRIADTSSDPLAIPPPPMLALFDATTLTETPLPFDAVQFLMPSASGRYVAAATSAAFSPAPPSPTAPQGATIAIYDRDTGEKTTSDQPGAFAISFVWRPQHDEVWYLTNLGQGDADHVWRWAPGGTAIDAGPGDSPQFGSPFATLSSQRLSQGQPTFTPDGRFRVVVGSYSNVNPTSPPVHLKSADDDAAPADLLNPPGTGVAGVWPLSDGQLLVEDWITDERRNDIYLVDGAAHTSRALAATGNVVATGRDRFLALLHWVAAGGSGDLTMIDYATGTQTLIAQNVSAVMVDMAATPSDVLAPGTRVAYLVHNRIASPYDGLWVIDLP